MRTAFVGAHETPNGVNSYTYNLAQELTQRGFESFVISFGSSNKVSEYNGIKILQYKTWGGTMTSIPLLYFQSLPYLIRHRKEIDVVMFQTVMFSFFPSLIVRLFGMRPCSIIHSLAEDNPKHGRMMRGMLKMSMRVALLFNKDIITVSHTKAQEVFARYGKRCKVLPCGVFLSESDGTSTDILIKYGIREKRYFLSIGRIDPVKNIEVLIDAFKMHNHGDYQLVIGGDVDNTYGRTIVSRASGCRDIIFTGIVVGEKKATLLRNCAAYCLVSSSEGLPIALLEGLSYGKVPIVSRIPSIQEVLCEGGIGLWSDVRDVNGVVSNMLAVESGLSDLILQGKIAREIVEKNYTWPQICDKYLEMCDRSTKSRTVMVSRAKSGES